MSAYRGPNRQLYLYFAATTDGSFVKVGFTGNLQQRMKDLQPIARFWIGNGIVPVGYMPISHQREEYLTINFLESLGLRHFVRKQNGQPLREWFVYDQRLQALLSEMNLRPWHLTQEVA